MNKKPAKVHFPRTRLSMLVARSGGISQSAALDSAQKNVDEMRDEGDTIIRRAIAEIGDLAIRPQSPGTFTDAELTDVLNLADQIVTVAETFAYASLNTIAKSLCDLADGFLAAGIRDRAPVIVHVQALTMMAPGGAPISDKQFEIILNELSKVRKHFGIASTVDADSVSPDRAAAFG